MLPHPTGDFCFFAGHRAFSICTLETHSSANLHGSKNILVGSFEAFADARQAVLGRDALRIEIGHADQAA